MNKTTIEWTEKTWNPSIGCTEISDGCKNCYAKIMAKRLQAMGTNGYKDGFKFKIIPERLNQPLKLKKPTKFFVNSMSDLFHEEMPFNYIDKIMEEKKKTPQHIYQILTKREKIMDKYFSNRTIPKNIWLGVTVESQKYLYRLDYLRNLNASVKFISMEPLLSPITNISLDGIDWVIVGGESGVKARPMNQKWVESIRDQCQNQNTAFFFKQWGTWGSDGIKRNKKINGRSLVGKLYDEYPLI